MSERIIPDITVIIPVRGRAELLREAILSVLNGRALPAELIVVVDGTPGETVRETQAAREIFSDFGERRTLCRIIHGTVRGPAGARNAGIRVSRSPWLAFLDSDDLWTAEKLSRQWDFLSKRPHLHGCQTLEIWRKGDRLLSQPQHLRMRTGRFLKDSLHTCLISPSAVLLRRDCFDELGELDESFLVCEDFEFWLRYLSRHPLGLLEEPLVIKRSGSWPQQSARFHSLDRERIRAILKTVRAGRLRDDEVIHARLACRQKLEILRRGAIKRGRDHTLDDLQREIEVTFQNWNDF